MTCRISSNDVIESVPVWTGGTRIQLPDAIGPCHADRMQLDAGLTLVRSSYHPNVDLVEDSAQPDGSGMLVIALGLTGESGYVGRDGTTLGFKAGHTTVSAFRGGAGERRYRAGILVKQLRLLVDEALLSSYVGPDACRAWLPGAGVSQRSNEVTSPSASAQATALMRHDTTRSSARLDLHIHALSLLTDVIRPLLEKHAQGRRVSRMSQDDLLNIERVHQLMRTQLHRPLTLPYLCLAVGISEHKLKEGIRRVYGTTPYRLLHDLRMRHAWTLLETGCQVAQAGWQVGYEHPGNFSAAFTAFFGQSPKTVFGKRH
jgi:AraC family transcriptional activator of pyochelin receptor